MQDIFNFLEWKLNGLCGQISIEEADRLFFSRGLVKAEARRICARCDEKEKCLNYAILYDEEGVWAATTKKSRDLIRPIMLPHLLEEAIAEGSLEPRYYQTDEEEENQPSPLPQKAQLKALDGDVMQLVDSILLAASVLAAV